MLNITNVVKRVFIEFCHWRIAATDHAAGRFVEIIVRAGDGDDFQFGSMHGGTAVLAALAKQEFGLKGNGVFLS